MEQCPRLLTTTRERGAQQLGPLPKEQSSEQGSNRGGGFLGLSTVGRELPKGWVPKGWVQTKGGFGQRWVPGAL